LIVQAGTALPRKTVAGAEAEAAAGGIRVSEAAINPFLFYYWHLSYFASTLLRDLAIKYNNTSVF
jgi:hypothetical protein